MQKESFSTISSIVLEEPSTWENINFLTLDIDWASDEVLEYAIDLVEESGLPATWFVTHETALLTRLANNPCFELGIHPNFNPLLFDGSDSKGWNVEQVINKVKELVPNATSVRSHSMTQSTSIQDVFLQAGLTHDCNHFIPYQYVEGDLCPWALWNGLIKVPYFWEDDLEVLYSESVPEKCFDMETVTAYSGIKVFDFHPIHLFMNTDTMGRYESARPSFQRYEKLKEFINNTEQGVRGHFLELASVAIR